MFGTKRTGPDLSRVGRQVRPPVAPHPLPQPARPGARLGDAAVPVDRRTTRRSSTRWSPTCRRLGRAKDWRPDQRLRAVERRERLHLAERLLRLLLLRPAARAAPSSSSARPCKDGYRGPAERGAQVPDARGRGGVIDDATNKDEIQEYAGGWITERKGTEVPGFLKLAYRRSSACASIVYLSCYMNGEVAHADRGPLVQQFNATTEQRRHGSMYVVAALVAGVSSPWLRPFRLPEER